MKQKTILVVNDDGIHGPGLAPLMSALRPLGRVVVVVPQQERSAASHAITLHKPIRLREIRKDWYITNGTPADCVRLGVTGVLRERVDAVVSGVNQGANLGSDTLYSGTVGAAKEGCLLGFPSVALSLTSKDGTRFDTAARFARSLVRWMLRHGLPAHCFFNVNVPDVAWKDLRGAFVTRLGRRIYGRRLTRRRDPRGQHYYWMAGAIPRGVDEKDSDVGAVAHRAISVSLLRLLATVEDGPATNRPWPFLFSARS
ncbi:MAG: 5'/3'-nucleotidase SurE [Elusimicrobia bacterium]|nr:5'/3'-nucleotidase SurE [Elusimicrobiota bacterium]